MTSNQPATANEMKAAKLALRRTAAAFALDHTRFGINQVLTQSGSRAIELTYDGGHSGDLIRQEREVRVLGTRERYTESVRLTVSEMVWKIALAHRASDPLPPTGWSIHPVAASVIAAAGTTLPNPADPLSWLRWDHCELRLPDGGNVVSAAFTARENVLILDRASIVNAAGAVVAKMHTEGPALMAVFDGLFPETCVDVLPGRSAENLCAVFAADPRGASAWIKQAENVYTDLNFMVVAFEDCLVPLLAVVEGREMWRPRKCRPVVSSHKNMNYAQYYANTSIMQARYAARRRYALTRMIAPRPPAII